MEEWMMKMAELAEVAKPTCLIKEGITTTL